MTPMENEDLLEPVLAALTAAVVNRDKENIADAVDTVFSSGPRGVYAACCVWAETARQLALTPGEPSGWYGLEVHTSTGRGSPEDVAPEHQAAVWAAQFVAAYANDDQATTAALFKAHLNDLDRLTGNVLELLKLAAAVVRDQARRGTDPSGEGLS